MYSSVETSRILAISAVFSSASTFLRRVVASWGACEPWRLRVSTARFSTGLTREGLYHLRVRHGAVPNDHDAPHYAWARCSLKGVVESWMLVCWSVWPRSAFPWVAPRSRD